MCQSIAAAAPDADADARRTAFGKATHFTSCTIVRDGRTPPTTPLSSRLHARCSRIHLETNSANHVLRKLRLFFAGVGGVQVGALKRITEWPGQVALRRREANHFAHSVKRFSTESARLRDVVAETGGAVEQVPGDSNTQKTTSKHARSTRVVS